MRIMVFDVSAESGGAFSILCEFYNQYKADMNNEYIFVVSKPELRETGNINILRFPWIKKSRFHRLYFDYIVAPGLISKYKIDNVLSLQNVTVPRTQIYQTLYLHNAIPFTEYKFSIFDSRVLWLQQNILSRLILKSIKKADRVIVQTNWMKEKCIEKLHIDPDKIEVCFTNLNIHVQKLFDQKAESYLTFFYPANGSIFKNHRTIIKACIRLKEQQINNYKVIFTLEGNENRTISKLSKLVKGLDLPVHFVGRLDRNQVFDFYSKSILIFPSYLETIGLPLLEGKMHETPIIASDFEYSREVLLNYPKVIYFQAFDDIKLCSIMKKFILYFKLYDRKDEV